MKDACHWNGTACKLLIPALLLIAGVSSPTASAQDGAADDRWEMAMQMFEEQDAENPPEPGGVVLYGSSSIRRWPVRKSFPDMKVVNRGFGGSKMSDANRYFERIVVPHQPRVIVLYEGDNDIGSGMTPEEVLKDFQAFVKLKEQHLPDTKLVVLSVKPSIRRWNMIDKIRETNALIEELCNQHPDLVYVDVDTPMIGKDGRPRKDLLADDNLHLSDAGYELWNGLVRPHLEEE